MRRAQGRCYRTRSSPSKQRISSANTSRTDGLRRPPWVGIAALSFTSTEMAWQPLHKIGIISPTSVWLGGMCRAYPKAWHWGRSEQLAVITISLKWSVQCPGVGGHSSSWKMAFLDSVLIPQQRIFTELSRERDEFFQLKPSALIIFSMSYGVKGYNRDKLPLVLPSELT